MLARTDRRQIFRRDFVAMMAAKQPILADGPLPDQFFQRASICPQSWANTLPGSLKLAQGPLPFSTRSREFDRNQALVELEYWKPTDCLPYQPRTRMHRPARSVRICWPNLAGHRPE